MTGAIVSAGKDEYMQINAKSVVIASGDYAADDEMFQYYSPMTAYAMDGRFYNPPDCDTGDMHKQAIWRVPPCRSPSRTRPSCTSTSARPATVSCT